MCTTETNTSEINNIPTQNSKEITGEKEWGMKKCCSLGAFQVNNTMKSSVCVCVTQSCLPLCDPRQASLSMEFSRQEYWSGLPLPSQEDLPDPVIEPLSPASQADSLSLELQGSPKSSALGI